MFENCGNSLAELNAERRRLILSGKSAAMVNAAFNRKRAELLARKPEYKRPPKFTAKAPETMPGYTAFTLVLGQVPKNVIKITGSEVYI